MSLSLGWQSVLNSRGYDMYLNGSRVANTQANAYTFASLLCGTSYTLGVDSFDLTGRRSRITSVVGSTNSCPAVTQTDTVPPVAPSNLTLGAASATSISLAWTASSDNVAVTGYNLYLNGGKVGTTSATSYSFTGLTCGTSYALTVAAYDAATNLSQPASVQASTSLCPDTSPPTTPTLLVQTGSTGTSISLSWSASFDNVGVVGYGMYVNRSQVTTTTWPTATFSGLACGTSYTLSVDAYDAAGNRSPQASVVASTAACTAVTTTFVATADTYASEDTQTTAHGSYPYVRDQGATPQRYGYLRFDPEGLSGAVTRATLRVYATSNSSAGFGVYALTNHTWQESTLTWTNKPAFDSAVVASSSPLQSGSWTPIDVTPLVAGNGTVDLALATSDTGSLYLASRETGATAPQLVVTTGGGGGGADAQPPTTPGGLSVGPATANSLSLTWSSSTDNTGVAGYNVYLNGSKVATTTSTAYTFGNLACGTGYTVAVAAYDAAGSVSQAASLAAATSACATTTVVSCNKTAQPGLGSAQALLDSLAPGQTGCLHGGTYTDSGDVLHVRSSNAGSAGAPVTIRSYPDETAKLYGTIEIQGPFFTLSNVSIEGDGAGNTVQVMSSDAVIQDSDITNAWRGRSCVILGDHTYGVAQRTLIQRNTFHDCGSTSVTNQTHGIYMSYGFDNHVTHNVFYNIFDFAIQMGPDAHRTLFDYNTVDGSAGTSERGGVLVWDEFPYMSTDNTINKNIITYAATYNLDTWWGAGVGSGNTADGNCMWQGVQGNINPDLSGLTATNSTIANPLFVNRSGRDYHLQTVSPCAGKGAF